MEQDDEVYRDVEEGFIGIERNDDNDKDNYNYNYHDHDHDHDNSDADVDDVDVLHDNISFRTILPEDRNKIQELFEEWFPVEYNPKFYDDLCNHKIMGTQDLYTLVATTTSTSTIIHDDDDDNDNDDDDDDDDDDDNRDHDDSDDDDNPPRIIACLLGCKLKANKLNEASRELLIPGYQPRPGVKNEKDSNDNDDNEMDSNDKSDYSYDDDDYDNNNNNNNINEIIESASYDDDNIENNNTTTSNSANDDKNNANNEENNNQNNDANDNSDDSIIEYTDVFYIMTLGVVKEYRKLGLASYLLERALEDQIVVVDNNDNDNENENDNEDDEEEGIISTTIEEYTTMEGNTIEGCATEECTMEECTMEGYSDDDGDDDNSNNPYDFNCDDDNNDAISFGRTPYNINRSSTNPQRQHRCCETAYLHVIINNDAACRFYEKCGFVRIREIPDYYTIKDEKHNCYLYIKFFDNNNKNNGDKGIIATTKTVVSHWITSIWSAISSYYWI
jgi:GNAT superfamily N-acetyltransferase